MTFTVMEMMEVSNHIAPRGVQKMNVSLFVRINVCHIFCQICLALRAESIHAFFVEKSVSIVILDNTVVLYLFFAII